MTPMTAQRAEQRAVAVTNAERQVAHSQAMLALKMANLEILAAVDAAASAGWHARHAADRLVWAAVQARGEALVTAGRAAAALRGQVPVNRADAIRRAHDPMSREVADAIGIAMTGKHRI